MLVLSRKVGQSLVIADGVTVTVSEIGPDLVTSRSPRRMKRKCRAAIRRHRRTRDNHAQQPPNRHHAHLARTAQS